MQLIRLTPSHVDEYRSFMLDAYAREPHAFTSPVPEREALPTEWWASRVSDRPESDERAFGAFVGGQLVGAAGLRFARRIKTRHKAWMFGLSVLPRFRGRGVARDLVAKVLEEAGAAPEIRVVQLTVTASNAPAIRLYEACGFLPFGTEPFAIRSGDGFLAKVHMWRPVGELVGGAAGLPDAGDSGSV